MGIGDGIRMERGMDLAFSNFSLLTSDTTVGVFLHIRLNVRPPVVSGDQLLCLIAAWVSGGDRVVMSSDDIFMKSFVSWDVESFLPFDGAVGG